jgi:hypothetical protein
MWTIALPGDSVEGHHVHCTQNRDCEAAQLGRLLCAVTVIVAVQCSAVGGSFVRAQGPDSRRRSSYGLGIGNLSTDLASGMDETWFEGRMLVARTGVLQMQVGCMVDSDMLVV